VNHTMIALAAAVTVTACGTKPTAQQSAMPGMGNMPMAGMSGGRMRADSLLPLMRSHLDSLGQMSPQAAAGVLGPHDARMSDLLDAMGSDMTMMGMRPDSTWTALTDSVKRDLAELPTLSGRPLETRLPAHIARVRRLMAMHEAMMRTMTKP
jgi:hypothetical protein